MWSSEGEDDVIVLLELAVASVMVIMMPCPIRLLGLVCRTWSAAVNPGDSGEVSGEVWLTFAVQSRVRFEPCTAAAASPSDWFLRATKPVTVSSNPDPELDGVSVAPTDPSSPTNPDPEV